MLRHVPAVLDVQHHCDAYADQRHDDEQRTETVGHDVRGELRALARRLHGGVCAQHGRELMG